MEISNRPDAGLSLAGQIDGDVHRLPVRVYYEDTDFSGIVYHANYLRFLERGRTDFLRLAGIDQSALHAQTGGLAFSVRRMALEFVKPARMDDVITVQTRIAAMKGASLVMDQRILRGGETILTADVLVAAVRAGRPARLPEAVRALLPQAGGEDR